MELKRAEEIVEDLDRTLRRWCVRWQVAGSVRRGRREVGDIEIVVMPHRMPVVESQGLLPGLPRVCGLRIPLVEAIQNCADAMVERGLGSTYNGLDWPDPRYVRFRWKEEVSVDLFICTPETWGTILTIRTGSRVFSHSMACRARDLGLRWHEGRLLRPAGKDWAAIPLVDEQEVFDWLHVPWVPPQARENGLWQQYAPALRPVED